jgi:hypothetical protein
VSTSPDDRPHVARPSLWPIGFAIGIACTLVGLVVSVPVLVVGALITVVFGFLWAYDLLRSQPDTAHEEAEVVEAEHEPPSYDRSVFLSAATLGVGGLIGVVVTLPVLGFAVLPSFESSETDDVDLGPITKAPSHAAPPTFATTARHATARRATRSSSAAASTWAVPFRRTAPSKAIR